MKRSCLRLTAAAAAVLAAGCANPPIKVNKAVCMAVGAGLGAGGGLVIENNDNHGEDHHRSGSALVGALVGGGLGLLLCGSPPPPPPPPEPPKAKVEPPPPPPPPAPRRIVLRGVNFDFDKATIRDDAAVILDEAASLLNEESGVRVEVGGHTDAVGTDEYNQGLSERRAQAVVDYLAGKGVTAERLSSVGHGESKPVADNETQDGRAQNRRVELNVQQ